MKVTLKSCGNIDHGESPNKSINGAEEKQVSVSSLKEASAICIEYINKYELGGGNWIGGDVTENGFSIAYISYNGGIHKPEEVSNENQK